MGNSTSSTPAAATPDDAGLHQQLDAMTRQALALVAEFRRATPTPLSTLAFECALQDCLREGGRALVEHEYNHVEADALADMPVRLRLAGEEYKRRPKSPNTIATLFGAICLRRYRYEALERGVAGIAPLEMHLGIEAGLASPALAERIGRQAAGHTQGQVLDWLQREHGIGWSVASLRKVLASLSAGLSPCREPAQVAKVLQLLKKAERSQGPHQPVLAVGRDGIMVPMRHGPYQEAATATVSVTDRRGQRLGTVYLGQMPEPGQGTLSGQLTSLLSAVLTQWQGCRLRHVYVTDAGQHQQGYYAGVLRKMADPRRPGQRLAWEWVIDFWHACGYLAKLREALFGEAPAGWKWFRRMRHWLQHRKQGVGHVLRSASQHWNRVPTKGAARSDLFWEGYGYLRRRGRHMDYARYRRQGKPIGSGVTEAACKTMFTQRLKQSGMTWENEGGQVIVALRVLKLSGVWSQAFQSYQRSRPLPASAKGGSYQRHVHETFKKSA